MRTGCLLALLAIGGAASAQPAPQGLPQPVEAMRDAEFGVATRHFGLERRVQMYQWHATAQGYGKVWSAKSIDSGGFTAGHRNPDGFPSRSQRWLTDATIDGKPLPRDAVAALGQWRGFRPGFSALPGNLAATFQPEGDGLGSAENPLDPRIGDLRITWRELTLPPLAGRIELRAGRWMLASAGNDAVAANTVAAPEERIDPQYVVPLGIGAVVLALVLWLHRRRHRRGHDPRLQRNSR